MKRKKLVVIMVLMISMLALAACEGDTEPEESMYTDGIYTGSAEGYGGEIEIDLTIEDDVISDIEIISHSETEDLGDDAMDEIIDQVIGEQDTTDVEVVSGATQSSNAMIEAIEEALELARAEQDVT